MKEGNVMNWGDHVRNLIVSLLQNASRQKFTVCSILQQGRYSLSAQEKKKKKFQV
jgi:hypothetical protein